MEPDDQNEVLACRLTDPELARRKQELAKEYFAGLIAVHELTDGYEFYFPAGTEWADRSFAFIAYERECCPFFGFELQIEPNAGPHRLRIRGSQSVKSFVLAEFGELIPEAMLPN